MMPETSRRRLTENSSCITCSPSSSHIPILDYTHQRMVSSFLKPALPELKQGGSGVLFCTHKESTLVVKVRYEESTLVQVQRTFTGG
jgi:hypothetical protein